MSKAFTRESDEVPEHLLTNQRPSLVPPGEKNYLAAQGAHKLQEMLQQLTSEPITPQTRQRTFEIQKSLQSAVVVAPPPPPWTQVFFGATVTVRDHTGESTAYRIVGVDETKMGREPYKLAFAPGQITVKRAGWGPRSLPRSCGRTKLGDRKYRLRNSSLIRVRFSIRFRLMLGDSLQPAAYMHFLANVFDGKVRTVSVPMFSLSPISYVDKTRGKQFQNFPFPGRKVFRFGR